MDQKNEGHLDLRQRKTRALLVKALAELMEQQRLFEKANNYYRQISTI